MVYENFTIFEEVDSGNDITKTAYKVTVTTMLDTVVSWVSKDKGVGWLDGDFEHKFEMKPTADYVGQAGCYAVFQGSAGTIQDMKDGNRDGILILLQGSTNRISLLVMKDGAWEGSDFWSPYVFGTKYYITVKRVASTRVVTVKIRTGSHTGTLVDTLTFTPSIVASCQTVYAVQSREGGSVEWQSFEVENLDLQEVVIVEPTVTTQEATGIGRD